MNSNTITIDNIRKAAREYEARGMNRIALRLRSLAARCDSGEINPETAIQEFRQLENQHRIPFDMRRRVALQLEDAPERVNRSRKSDSADFAIFTVFAIVAVCIGAAIVLAFRFIP